jgi:type IV fimbrial biogenesis protein FimT
VLRAAPQAGFSIVEILVGLAIFAILTMSALPAYSVWIQNTKIRNAAESVQNGLQLARSEAVRRNTNVQFAFGTDSEWTVSVVDPAETIQARRSEQGSVDVLVTTTPAATTVTFNALGRAIPNPSGLPSFSRVDFDMPPNVVPPALSRELRVTISAGGRIRMCDPSVGDAADTRFCN